MLVQTGRQVLALSAASSRKHAPTPGRRRARHRAARRDDPQRSEPYAGSGRLGRRGTAEASEETRRHGADAGRWKPRRAPAQPERLHRCPRTTPRPAQGREPADQQRGGSLPRTAVTDLPRDPGPTHSTVPARAPRSEPVTGLHEAQRPAPGATPRSGSERGRRTDGRPGGPARPALRPAAAPRLLQDASHVSPSASERSRREPAPTRAHPPPAETPRVGRRPEAKGRHATSRRAGPSHCGHCGRHRGSPGGAAAGPGAPAGARSGGAGGSGDRGRARGARRGAGWRAGWPGRSPASTER